VGSREPIRSAPEGKLRTSLLIPLLTFSFVLVAQSTSEHDAFIYARREITGLRTVVPKNGYIPDEGTAVAMAYAVAVPIYGKSQMEREKPFRAELEGGVWTVLGTLQGSGPGSGVVGGTLIMQIDQQSGRIRFLGHDE